MSASPHQRLFSFLVFVILASLDNAASGVLPPLYAIISQDLQANEAALGLVTAVYLLIVAISATYWGYRGDQGTRKKLLLYGTLVWGGAMILTGLSQTYFQLLLFQMVTAVGVGSIGSVGFSVISDLIPAQRRGFALSLWSISQLLGGAFGALLGGSLGAFDWRWPFFVIAGAGFLFAILYHFTIEPQRGQAEPELAAVFASGSHYEYRITLADIQQIFARRANIWLLTQGFFWSLAYGATVWIPRWAIARVQAEGYNLEMATIIGNLFVTLFGIGAFLAIPAGHLGDKLQKRTPYGRTRLAAIGLLSSIPFFVLLYFIPLRNVSIPQTNNLLTIGWAVITSIFTNPWVTAAFVVAFIALALFSADAPNWAALITDVNLPEHRGTVIGLSRLFRAVGNAISVALVGVTFNALSTQFAPPDTYAIGLALFQLLVIPAGLCYYWASKTIPEDITVVKQILTTRAKAITST